MFCHRSTRSPTCKLLPCTPSAMQADLSVHCMQAQLHALDSMELPSWVLEAVVVLFGLRHKGALGCNADVNAAWPSLNPCQPMLRRTDFYEPASCSCRISIASRSVS